jgi:hypothetical protein
VTPGQPTRGIDAFTFPGATGDNYTGAEMGELAKTSTGYIFSGAYNRGASNNNSSRNLFLLTFNDGMTTISNPIWLTNYNNSNIHAVSPKIVSIGNAEYLVLWEELSRNSNAVRTFMAIVDEQGTVKASAKEIPGAVLNGHDVLRYSPATGLAYWAVRNAKGNISLYALDPRAELRQTTPPPPTTPDPPGPNQPSDPNQPSISINIGQWLQSFFSFFQVAFSWLPYLFNIVNIFGYALAWLPSLLSILSFIF